MGRRVSSSSSSSSSSSGGITEPRTTHNLCYYNMHNTVCSNNSITTSPGCRVLSTTHTHTWDRNRFPKRNDYRLPCLVILLYYNMRLYVLLYIHNNRRLYTRQHATDALKTYYPSISVHKLLSTLHAVHYNNNIISYMCGQVRVLQYFNDI